MVPYLYHSILDLEWYVNSYNYDYDSNNSVS